jgi:translation initiation factor 1
MARPRRSGNSDMVWSSSDGDLRKARDPKTKTRQTTGPVKVRREIAGRKGKGVTTVFNLPLSDTEIRDLAAKLKKRCGVGGSAKDGVIELQGDHRDTVVAALEADGYDVVRAGG